MYSAKVLLYVATLAGASLAQITTATFKDPEACSSTKSSFSAGAPTYPPALSPYLDPPFYDPRQTAPGAATTSPPGTLEDPEGYVKLLCSVAAELPSSLLPEFHTWGAAIISYGSVHLSAYDAYVTQCVTTGEAAATLTSYLNNLLTGTGGFCQPTTAPSSNGTISTTAAPAATGSSTKAVVTAAAARPTGVFAGAAAMGGLAGAVALL